MNSFDTRKSVIKKLEKEFGKSDFIMSSSVKVQDRTILTSDGVINDLQEVAVRVYQIKNLFFIYQNNSSRDQLALMFRAALSEEELEEFEAIKSSKDESGIYNYSKAIEFLAKNSF
jgi:hypothetical protein